MVLKGFSRTAAQEPYERVNSDVPTEAEITDMRRDRPLDEAFQAATGGAISSPNVLQHALFPRLLTQDTGLLLPTGPGAGRLEAVYVPTIASRADSSHYGLPRQRLFIIAADGTPLDDYYERLARYLRKAAAQSGVPRTLYIAAEEDSSLCDRYMPDGSLVEKACNHPLDPGVDLAVAPFSHFRSLFFGAGGVHALPQSLLPSEDAIDMRPRDLFYFDEAMGYGADEFVAFLRLVEFLFTQDLDIILGTTTLPAEYQEDLGFLETVSVPEAQYEPPKTLQSVAANAAEQAQTIENLLLQSLETKPYLIVCLDHANEARTLYQHFTKSGHQNRYSAVYEYDSRQPRAERAGIYAELLARESRGEPYVLFVDGPALEASDLSADLLITTVCAPESLVRRSGRVNRRGGRPDARILVVGDGYPKEARALAPARRQAYWEALAGTRDGRTFRAQEWKDFIA